MGIGGMGGMGGGLDPSGDYPPVVPQQASNDQLRLRGQSQAVVYGQEDLPQQHYRKSLGDILDSLPDSTKRATGMRQA